MKIGLIGVGNLGMSIAKGLIHQQAFEITQLVLVDKHADLSALDQYENVRTTTNSQEAVKLCDVVIVCVQPRHVTAVMNDIAPELDEGRHLIISTVTGTSLSEIRNALHKDIPTIRSMPNTAISVGQSMTCLCANDAAKNNIQVAEKIFNAMGQTAAIEEHMMQAATVICASGIAFWMRLIRATTEGGVEMGFEADEAKKMATQACAGAAQLLTATGNHPETEIDRVTTPNGCTIAGLNEMEHRGISAAMIGGLMKSFDKISDISKEK